MFVIITRLLIYGWRVRREGERQIPTRLELGNVKQILSNHQLLHFIPQILECNFWYLSSKSHKLQNHNHSPYKNWILYCFYQMNIWVKFWELKLQQQERKSVPAQAAVAGTHTANLIRLSFSNELCRSK